LEQYGWNVTQVTTVLLGRHTEAFFLVLPELTRQVQISQKQPSVQPVPQDIIAYSDLLYQQVHVRQDIFAKKEQNPKIRILVPPEHTSPTFYKLISVLVKLVRKETFVKKALLNRFLVLLELTGMIHLEMKLKVIVQNAQLVSFVALELLIPQTVRKDFIVKKAGLLVKSAGKDIIA